jgi:hypothetical protein
VIIAIAAALLVGIVIAATVFLGAVWVVGARRRKQAQRLEGARRKVEFSKLMLACVLFTYFVGVGVGVKIALVDVSQLGVLLAFIGTPTAASIGFYVWKAKAENIIKIRQAYPEETGGTPVDLNDMHR